jgi:hypothetical protein
MTGFYARQDAFFIFCEKIPQKIEKITSKIQDKNYQFL